MLKALERRCLSLGREADALLLAALGRWRGHLHWRSGLAFLAREPPQPPVQDCSRLMDDWYSIVQTMRPQQIQEAWLPWPLLTRQARDAEARNSPVAELAFPLLCCRGHKYAPWLMIFHDSDTQRSHVPELSFAGSQTVVVLLCFCCGHSS